MEKEQLIQKGKEIYGGKYDYSLVVNKFTTKEKLVIICPEHGKFEKSYEKHINSKQGCPVCSGRFRYDTHSFIEKCKTLSDVESITFDNVNYVNNKTKVKMYCHHKDENGFEHGEFEIAPGHFLSGERCPKCRYIKSAAGKRRTISEVIAEANKIHDNKYDYSLITEYKNDRIKYSIICPEHGIFEQTMNNHIKGKQGCPVCGRLKGIDKRTDTFDEFVRKAKFVHSNEYEYLDDNYIKSDVKIGITCKKHGVFYMTPSNHLMGQQCPKCAFSHSKGEDEMFQYILSICQDTIQRDRNLLDGEEIDIVVPSKRIGFEYNGLHWHSELTKDKNYHLQKTLKCNEKGYRLIHFFEDEWLHKKDIVKSIISSVLGGEINKIFARKCEIKEVGFNDSRNFLDNNHLQGCCPSKCRYGLYFNGELVSLMAFGKSRHFVGNGKCKWELLRFCNKINTVVIGGASKLLKHFIKKHNPEEIISYADRRWSNGDLYNKLNFKKYNESKPNYCYIRNNKRVYRFNLRKSVLIKKYNCPPEMTEKEFCFQQKWYRIYDCGCLCYKWTK